MDLALSRPPTPLRRLVGSKILMVTGHRRVRHPAFVLRSCCHLLNDEQPDLAISGGAPGTDVLFIQACCDLDIPYVVVLPNQLFPQVYRGAVSEDLLAGAEAVRYAVDRPVVANWRERWRAEQWWKDNFLRNTVMIGMSTDTACVSPTNPNELLRLRSGGTVHCLKQLQRLRSHPEVLWIPDSRMSRYCRVPLTA